VGAADQGANPKPSDDPGAIPAPARAVVAIEPWSPADDDVLPQGQIKKKSFLFFR
jgi:hypothetical protein